MIFVNIEELIEVLKNSKKCLEDLSSQMEQGAEAVKAAVETMKQIDKMINKVDPIGARDANIPFNEIKGLPEGVKTMDFTEWSKLNGMKFVDDTKDWGKLSEEAKKVLGEAFPEKDPEGQARTEIRKFADLEELCRQRNPNYKKGENDS